MIGEAVPQITKPSRVIDESERHVMSSPADIATFIGPVEPLNRVPPIVIWSQQASVSKNVAVAYRARVARTVQASWLPCAPAPSVTHAPLVLSWQ